MKILITGGGGFLGLHLARYFSRKKIPLTLLDLHGLNKNEYPNGCKFVIGDVRDKKLIDKLTRQNDIVIHTAAGLPLWKPEEIISINIDGTRNMLESALKNKIKHFIHISSTAVYGVPKKHPIEENDPKVGVGPYGISKVKAEELCLEYRKKGLLTTVIRPKTFVGTHRLGVFEILFDWIHDGKRIPVIGDGNNRYQLLDVDDLVEAIYLLIRNRSGNRGKVNDAFNIGADKFGTVKEDLNKLFKFAHSGSRLLPTPSAPIKIALFILEKLRLSPLYQWVYDTADRDSFASIEKLKKALDWKPRYSNSEALIKSYKWYLRNYKDIKSRGSGVTHTVGWNQGVLGFFKRFL